MKRKAKDSTTIHTDQAPGSTERHEAGAQRDTKREGEQAQNRQGEVGKRRLELNLFWRGKVDKQTSRVTLIFDGPVEGTKRGRTRWR